MKRTVRMLVTGVGRRVELLQAFRSAAQRLGIGLWIIGVDSSATAPALAFCDDTWMVCGMKDPGYVCELVRICKDSAVDLLVPTIDTDLQVLADSAEAFDGVGTRVVVSSPAMISLCRDKNLTARFFAEAGLSAPETAGSVSEYKAGFPCFIKPKDGSSSINAFRADSAEELETYACQIGDYVIQPYIEGDEYTVDVFCDFEGNPIHITPRRRLAVRAGEVLKTEVRMDSRIVEECLRLVEVFRPCGPLTVQLIRQSSTGTDFFIEINPRFGGGSPLSMRAGADSAEALLSLVAGADVPGFDARRQEMADGAVYSRFDQSVRVGSGEPSGSVSGVVFDLDDTLFSERDYARSGFRAIADLLEIPGLDDELLAALDARDPTLDLVLSRHGLLPRKKECLVAYRSHTPDIEPYPGVLDLLRELRDAGVRVGILTDGRPKGQRGKIDALGLTELVDDVVVTDELGGAMFRKPCDIGFRVMQRRWGIPFDRMLYVADNRAKDFRAPRELGMRSLYFENGDGLYATDSNLPLKTVRSIAEMRDAIADCVRMKCCRSARSLPGRVCTPVEKSFGNRR